MQNANNCIYIIQKIYFNNITGINNLFLSNIGNKMRQGWLVEEIGLLIKTGRIARKKNCTNEVDNTISALHFINSSYKKGGFGSKSVEGGLQCEGVFF